MKYKVVELEQTCWACPSQWDAKTDDGKYIYIRYRWGYLSAQITGPRGKEIFGKQLGDGLDGLLPTNEMMEELSEIMEFEL